MCTYLLPSLLEVTNITKMCTYNKFQNNRLPKSSFKRIYGKEIGRPLYYSARTQITQINLIIW